MKDMLTDVSISLSEFKQNPVAALGNANYKPMAVVTPEDGAVAFYALAPALYEVMLKALADNQLYNTVVTRLACKDPSIEVRLEDL